MTTNWQDPSAPTPPPSASAAGGQNNRKRFAIIATLLVVIAGLATTAGLVMVNRNSDDTATAQYVVMDVASTTPVFEPRDARGNDPFFPLEVQLASFQNESQAELDRAGDASNTGDAGTPGAQFDIAALDDAVKTGLYGGTEENTCDPERLISFLYANPDLGEAWAKVQGIAFVEIADYIRGLEIRVLAEPVNVLNHGFNASTASAYEIDTVLDAGTAVLVDANGDIRTRCYCGNPIKPKPPEHMPPRCLVYGALVYTEPGSTTKRPGASRDVLLTGHQAEVTNGGTWIEVKWGTADNEKGWVPAYGLQKGYCPTPTNDRYCPGPGETKVWHTPDATTPVGRVTGKVRTADTTLDVFAPINPVGGLGAETIFNDFMLIRFTEAASAQNSAWVRLSDLDQDASQCERVRQCINTEGPVWDRAGGAPIPGADGVIWAEFTGHFAANPATHTEIRLNNGSGAYGWIGLFYTPLPDERCEPPVLDCVEDAVVYETSTQSDPDHLGYLSNTTVEITGGPQDGRLSIRFYNGPDGWVDQADFYDGYDYCEPPAMCLTSMAPGYTIFPDQGIVVNPSIPTPKVVETVGQVIEIGASTWMLINIDGTNYWIDAFQVHYSKCEPPTVECPESPYTSLLDNFAPRLRDPGTLDELTEMTSQMMANSDNAQPSSECCVSELYESPSLADVSATPTPASVFVIGSTVDGLLTWYRTIDGEYFLPAHILDSSACELASCPSPYDGPSFDDTKIDELRELLADEGPAGLVLQIDQDQDDLRRIDGRFGQRPTSGDCCVSQVFSNFEGILLASGPRWVDVAGGPHSADPSWYQTTDGVWFPETAVVEDSACRPIMCPDRNAPGTGELDEDIAELERLFDELGAGMPVTRAARLFIQNDTVECCISGQLFNQVDGDVALTLDEPTAVLVVDIDDTGEWYKIWVEPVGTYWVPADSFLDLGQCAPSRGCPAQSIIEMLNEGDDTRFLCCIAFQTNGDPVYDQVVFTTETREIDGAIEHLALDGEWVPTDDFVDTKNCVIDVTCPDRESIIDPSDLLTCCVSLGSAEFEAVTLTGETRELGGGVLEYEATNGEWYLASDFASAGRCGQDSTPCDGQLIGEECCARPNQVFQQRCVPPCPTGQVRNGNGVCQAPAQPTSPTPTVTSTPVPGCQNSDDDTHCDADDNCDFNTNEGQTDADDDGQGDACDPCTDADRDLFCEIPGDINNDNCWGRYNPGQSDADNDGVGDLCDNCPAVANPQQTNADGDGLGDACECPSNGATGGNGDRDGDGVCDVDDNCVSTPNPGQSDRDDRDGYGDACDNCPDVYNPNQADTYGQNGVGDACECPAVVGAGPTSPGGDSDNDGVCDVDDNCRLTPNPGQPDGDGDGVGDGCDNCPSRSNSGQSDVDGDGHGDGCDFCPGPNGPVVADKIANPDQGFLYDSDGDGVRDTCFVLR